MHQQMAMSNLCILVAGALITLWACLFAYIVSSEHNFDPEGSVIRKAAHENQILLEYGESVPEELYILSEDKDEEVAFRAELPKAPRIDLDDAVIGNNIYLKHLKQKKHDPRRCDFARTRYSEHMKKHKDLTTAEVHSDNFMTAFDHLERAYLRDIAEYC